RALLDGAGVDKALLADALGAPSGFGQSQFALARGTVFEARVKADGGAELLRLVHARVGGTDAEPTPDTVRAPDLSAIGPEGRTARTALALRGASRRSETSPGTWTFLDHPMLALDVAGSPAFLEPDAVVVHPDGSWTVVEIKSFPMIDGAADPSKVGAAARQAAVYVLALEQVAARLEDGAADTRGRPRVRDRVVLVCPKDFTNLPAASAVDVRKQLSVTRRQLARLTRVEEIAEQLPPGTRFDPEQPADELVEAVESVPATYAPECLAACELAFHCRDRARAAGAVTALGRPVRAELGGLTTVAEALAAAHGETGDPRDPTVAALRRAAALRAQALEGAR
ncbi:S66 peptidase family protein, partial [Streptomyces beihaiensis]